jgi:hypothetical protein
MDKNINDYLPLIARDGDVLLINPDILKHRKLLGKRIWSLMAYVANKDICQLVEFETGINPIAYTRRKSFQESEKELFDIVANRDGVKCGYCGTQFDLTVDHITPISAGGSNHPDNLQILCRSCNGKKGMSNG